MGSLLPQQTSGVQVAWEVPALWSLDLDVLPRAKVSRHPATQQRLRQLNPLSRQWNNKFKVPHLECMIMIRVLLFFMPMSLCLCSTFNFALTYWSPCLPVPRVHLHPKNGTFDFRSAKQHPSSWHPNINIHKLCRFARYTVQTRIFVLVSDRTSSYQQLHSLQWIVNANCSAWKKHAKETTAFLPPQLDLSGQQGARPWKYWKKETAKSPPTLVGCVASPLRPVRFFPRILEHLVLPWQVHGSWLIKMAWLVSANLSSLQSGTAEN